MSGAEPHEPGADSVIIATSAGHTPRVHTWWKTPVSPHRAAWIEDKPLDTEHLRQWIQYQRADYVLVEGVGGWKVPLAMTSTGEVQYCVEDMARDVDGSILLVAPNRLGVLNHIQLTIAAIEGCGLTVQGVILNQTQSEPESVAEKTNLEDIRLLLAIPVTTCPFISEFKSEQIGSVGQRICRELSLIE